MIWAGHVACVGEIRNAYNILVGREHSECIGIDRTK
jgi:hypothetical protein